MTNYWLDYTLESARQALEGWTHSYKNHMLSPSYRTGKWSKWWSKETLEEFRNSFFEGCPVYFRAWQFYGIIPQ